MNLVDALAGQHDVEFGAVTTFPFDPSFFDRHAIGSLHDAGVGLPVVLMDGPTYQERVTSETWSRASLGERYYLEPITVTDVFHPKVALCTGDEAVSFMVSSANLTLPEYTNAAQLAASGGLERTSEATDPHRTTTAHVAADVLSFFEAMTDRYVTGDDVRTQLENTIEAGKWVTDIDTDTEPSAHFVHNLSEPIVDRVAQLVGDVHRVTLFAPFFGSGQSLDDVLDRLSPTEVTVAVAEDITHIDHADITEKLGYPVEFRPLEADSNRWNHAKFLLLEGADWSACLYGSPNMSAAALGATPNNGNLEAGLLRIEQDPAYFSPEDQPLFQSEHFQARLGDPADPDGLSLKPQNSFASNPPAPATEMELLDAKFRERPGGAQLELTIHGIEEPVDGVVRAIHRDLEIDCELEAGDTTTTEIFAVSSAWENALIRIEATDGRRSTVRQATGEPTPFASEAGDVLRTGGREGVLPLVDALLFGNQRVAGQTLSMAVATIEERLEQEEHNDEGQPDRTERSWGERGGTSSQHDRPAHLQIWDMLSLATDQIRAELRRDPSAEGMDRLVDHLENFWELCERCLLRYYLEQQRVEDTDHENPLRELDVDWDKLISAIESQLRRLVNEDLLKQVSDYWTQVLNDGSAAPEKLIDRQRAFDQLFSSPAMLLTLENWTAIQLFEPYRFTQAVFKSVTECHPHIAECLLADSSVLAGVDRKAEQYQELVDLIANRGTFVPTLPTDHRYGAKLLLHVVWCSELCSYDTDTGIYSRFDPETSIFNLAARSKRYDEHALQAMGELAVEGEELVSDTNGMETGHLAPLPDRLQRHKELRHLADGGFSEE